MNFQDLAISLMKQPNGEDLLPLYTDGIELKQNIQPTDIETGHESGFKK